MASIEPDLVALLWFALCWTVACVALLVLAGAFPLASRPDLAGSPGGAALALGNAALLAVCAPWIVLLLLGTQPSAVAAYQSAAGGAVLLGGLVASVVCYRVMLRIGALPEEKRVFA